GMVCVVGRMRDLILQLSKSSIYSTKPLIIQNKAGAFTELLVIAFWLMVIFIYLIITFTVLLNATPDFDDLVFYYECYLILFFCGSPLYLIMRMI
ncbi:hypothetical protein YA50_15960, partial [Enterobacter kobei]